MTGFLITALLVVGVPVVVVAVGVLVGVVVIAVRTPRYDIHAATEAKKARHERGEPSPYDQRLAPEEVTW